MNLVLFGVIVLLFIFNIYLIGNNSILYKKIRIISDNLAKTSEHLKIYSENFDSLMAKANYAIDRWAALVEKDKNNKVL